MIHSRQTCQIRMYNSFMYSRSKTHWNQQLFNKILYETKIKNDYNYDDYDDDYYYFTLHAWETVGRSGNSNLALWMTRLRCTCSCVMPCPNGRLPNNTFYFYVFFFPFRTIIYVFFIFFCQTMLNLYIDKWKSNTISI